MACKKLHAIVIPFPAQGHITPMFQLALKLLAEQRGFSTISFVNTEYDHERILANENCKDLLRVPGLRFVTIPDGLPPDHGRLNDPGPLQNFSEAINLMYTPLQILIQDMVHAASSSQSCPPITCIIADIFFSDLMADVAETVGVPWIAFWTSPLHANLVYCSMSHLLAQGILPIDCQESESTEQLIDCVPGMPPFKAFDVPSFLQPPGGSPTDFFFQWSLKRFGSGMPHRASCHLVNTVMELEKEATQAFEECIGRCLTIGPLLPPKFFSGEMAKAPAMGTSMWVEDKRCKEWLDMQEERSVLYISFGSIVHMATRQVEEVAAGIEASGCLFLWVLRSDIDEATRENLEAFKVRTRQRGLVVSWAPQLLVLSHPSIAAFLTHCGWNSILEGISSGVPMLAWSGGFGEQNMNATYIIHIWKIGLGFTRELTKDGLLIVNKAEIERVIQFIMNGCKQGQALRKNIVQLQHVVRDSLMLNNGSSHANLQHFLEAMTTLEPKSI